MQLRCSALAFLVILLPWAAQAQGTSSTEIIRGLCQKDGCAEFAILEKTPVAPGPDGQLFKTKVETFHASSQGRASQGEESGFVYCSATRPAVISVQPDRPATAFMLAPDEQSPAWAQRSSVNFFAIYFAVCHGPEAGRAAAKGRAGVAHSFAYHVPLTASRQISLEHAEDILKPPP
ncbi:hypothetical protein [Lichenifustis flavocetrariae]|uniref:Uncharacterized protein n=1 Tax=Lichenifustis flavocetrariae TaxID=2949735 RepID=A0AA41YRA2_9HYPH|nr:hypothetical protein [Lichenifustis flavocetrariae]MCW6507109.1 hypothetical protein [Lichenifustis flavocetrariae]